MTKSFRALLYALPIGAALLVCVFRPDVIAALTWPQLLFVSAIAGGVMAMVESIVRAINQNQ